MKNIISSITLTRNVSMMTVCEIPGGSDTVARLLRSVAEAGINIDMISQTGSRGGTVALSFTMADDDLTGILTVVARLRDGAPDLLSEVSSRGCKLSFYGDAMRDTPGVAAGVMAMLFEAGAPVKLITTSEADISVLIEEHTLADVTAQIRKQGWPTPAE